MDVEDFGGGAKLVFEEAPGLPSLSYWVTLVSGF